MPSMGQFSVDFLDSPSPPTWEHVSFLRIMMYQH
jgi:hypothetical protein